MTTRTPTIRRTHTTSSPARHAPASQYRQPVARDRRSAGSSRSPRVHHFGKNLALSNWYVDADWWMPMYQKAFPTLVSAVAVRQDGWAQRGGIDRLLILACGRTYTVNEKVRTADWPDVLLERWSDEARKAPGWVQKPLACDFIAYALPQPAHAY